MIKAALAVVSGVLLLAGCAGMSAPRTTATAIATLNPTQNNNVRGTVTFSPASGRNKILIVANIEGLTPGPHGFHIHESGNCSAPDASSAGGHFDPDNRAHGPSYHESGHAGDLGNLIADSYGNAQMRMEAEGLSLDNARNGILNRSVVVHARTDDLVSQPAGNSGPSVACGTIAIQ